MTPRGIRLLLLMSVASYKYKVWLVQQQHFCTAGQNMSYSLAFLLYCIFLSNALGDPCADGFMDLSLLETKAATPVGALADEALAESTETRWIISDNRFTCHNVTIEEVLFGADIRSMTGNRTMYPWIEIWYKDLITYYRLYNATIMLSPNNFTTNGLYRYTLPTTYTVKSGTYINLPHHRHFYNFSVGVYQPPSDQSVVRLFTATAARTAKVGRTESGSYNVSGIDESNTNNIMMIRLITGRAFNYSILLYYFKPSMLITDPSNCFNQVFSENDINTNSLSITSVIPVTDTRVFTDIHFTCTGIITNWLIGITKEQNTTKPYPNIYIKRSSQLIHALTVDTSAAISSNGSVYNFTSEVRVQSGDILVINVTNNSNPMYYQQYNGPLNYKLNNDELIPLEDNDYPLVSVIISKSYISLFCFYMIPYRAYSFIYWNALYCYSNRIIILLQHSFYNTLQHSNTIGCHISLH